MVTYGPWGGSGGTTFDDGSYTGIRQINVSRNVSIVYIKVFYDQNGETIPGNRLGGKGGFKTDKVDTKPLHKNNELTFVCASCLLHF